MKSEPVLPPLDGEPLRSAEELQRAARRQLRRHASQRGELPWRVPLLFVPGLGGSRVALREPHEPAERLRLMTRFLVLDTEQELIPTLRLALLDRYARLQAGGWTALPQAYWPLAAGLADVPGTASDPQFAHSAHAFAWDWRGRPAQAAPDLARRVQTLLAGTGVEDAGRPTRRPEPPGLVIVAENLGLDLVRAALPLCAPGAVLAVYAVDEATSAAALPACLLSMGWKNWHANLPASAVAAVNAVLPGMPGSPRGAPPATVDWITCLSTTDPAEQAAALRADSPAQLCNAIRRHIAQQLLRQPPTPWGQALAPAFLSGVATGESRP